MTSSQLLTFGLVGGGFILFAFLLIYFALTVRPLWRRPAFALVGNVKVPQRFAPLAAYFSDLASPLTTDNTSKNSGDVRLSAPVPKSKWIWLGVLFAALLITTLIEFSLIAILNSNGIADISLPLFGILVAGLMFAFACRKLVGPSVFIPYKAILPQRSAPPVALWITNISLSLIVISSVNLDLPAAMNYMVLGLWFINILLFCWNVAQLGNVSMPSREVLTEWWQAHRVDVLLVVLIGLAAFLIRFIGLERYPYAFINDEGEAGWEGLNILAGLKSNFFSTGWAGEPILAFLPVALSIKLFGISATSVRLIGTLQGTLAVVSLYLLAREAFGRPIAVLSSILLVAMPWHVHFSRLGVMNVGDSFYSASVLWLTYRALRKGRYIDYLLIGLMTGLSLYTYVGSRLVVAMAIGVLGYAVIRQRDYFKTHFRHLTIFIFAFLIVAGPGLYVFSLHYDEFLGRTNTEGLLASNRLQQIATQVGISPSDLLIRQVQLSSAIFFATSGPGQFFDTPKPYLDWWAAVFLFLGMIYVFWNFTQVRYILLLGWFWAPVLLGSALTIGPPSHQRMLSAAPAVALIVAIGLWKFAQPVQLITRIPRPVILTLCLLAAVFTAWQGYNFYFVGEFRTGHYFEDPSNEFSYEVGSYAGKLGPGYRLLILGEPSIYSAFADFHFLTNTTTNVEDFNGVTPEKIDALTHEKGIFFAAIPLQLPELRLVQQRLPGGQWIEVPRHTQEGMSYYGYILPPSTTSP